MLLSQERVINLLHAVASPRKLNIKLHPAAPVDQSRPTWLNVLLLTNRFFLEFVFVCFYFLLVPLRYILRFMHFITSPIIMLARSVYNIVVVYPIQSMLSILSCFTALYYFIGFAIVIGLLTGVISALISRTIQQVTELLVGRLKLRHKEALEETPTPDPFTLLSYPPPITPTIPTYRQTILEESEESRSIRDDDDDDDSVF